MDHHRRAEFRLRPDDHFSYRRVALDTRSQPCRIPIVIRAAASPARRAHLADEFSTVVVKPVEKFSIRAIPGKVRSAGMLDAAPLRCVRGIGWRCPCVSAITAV